MQTVKSRLLSKNIKIRIYKTIILPVILYRCETWSLILREEHYYYYYYYYFVCDAIGTAALLAYSASLG
jgi:hypothetical protein